MRKYIKLFEERYKDYQILSGEISKEEQIQALIQEIESPNYDLDYIKDLINYGYFDVNDTYKKGVNEWSFLIWATLFDKYEIVKLLLEKEADPNYRDSNGWNALMWSQYSAGSPEEMKIFEILLKYPQTNPNLQNNMGTNILMKVSNSGNIWAIKMLLNHPKINVNIQDSDGFTALMRASERGHSQVVQEFLKYPDIDIEIKNNYFKTAWDLAKFNIKNEFPELEPKDFYRGNFI
jgi:ankyrin repeat protein